MYYPKSQISTNLYTSGLEYSILTTGEEYIGFYWKESKGRLFTGKTPSDFDVRELGPYLAPDLENVDPSKKNIIQIASFGGDPDPSAIYDYDYAPILANYLTVKNIDLNKTSLLPTFQPNIPTNKDYQIGEYRRYFCKKINEINYVEISKDYHDKLLGGDESVASSYFIPFNIPWTLIGDKEQVYKINKNIVELTMKRRKLPMFNKYLQEDYLKYYKHTA